MFWMNLFKEEIEKGNKCEALSIANVFRTYGYKPNDQIHHDYMIGKNKDIKNYIHDKPAADSKLKNISYSIRPS